MSNSTPVSNPSLSLYFQINEKNYSRLIDSLLAETEALQSASTQELTQARRDYFVAAISRGVDISDLPQKAAFSTAADIIQAIGSIPDKEATGWVGVTSLDTSDRQSFKEAAAKRPSAMAWDNLFTNGNDEIILPFSKEAQSLDDKIGAFIAAYNARALENFARAQEKDREMKKQDHTARPRAGKAIEEREIRRKTDSRGKIFLETHIPGEPDDTWKPGPKFGKFLQDQYEWELFDLFQLEMDKSQELTTQNLVLSEFKDIADHAEHAVDALYDSGDLRVVISRDAQKIGEMSTGQRWRSCMAKDGINYQYVLHDIEAGSLVAYVVHKDDTEARYPLMRQLIKPFRSKAGQELTETANPSADALLRETILVPSNVYGGQGSANSRTRDGLKRTLRDFTDLQNADKLGAFHMDPNLYADGQAVTARLSDDWSSDDICNAVHDYQDGAFLEYAAELDHYKARLYLEKPDQHGRLPAENIDRINAKIRRIVDEKNTAAGLPRMFHQEMIRSSPGMIPNPKAIISALSGDKFLTARKAALEALTKQDRAAWEKHAPILPSKSLIVTAILSHVANNVRITRSPMHYTESDKAKEEAREFTAGIIKDVIESINIPEEKFETAVFALKYTGFIWHHPLSAYLGEVVLDNIHMLPNAEKRAEIMEYVIPAVGKIEPLRKHAVKLLLQDIETLPTVPMQIKAACLAASYGTSSLTAENPAIDIFLDKISGLPDKAQYIHDLRNIIDYCAEHSPQMERGLILLLDVIEHLPAKERIGYSQFALNYKPSPAIMARFMDIDFDSIASLSNLDERKREIEELGNTVSRFPDPEHWLGILLDKIPTLPTAADRISALNSYGYNWGLHPVLQEQSLIMRLQDIPALPSTTEKINAAHNVIYRSENYLALQEQAIGLILKYIPEMPTAAERIKDAQFLFTSCQKLTTPPNEPLFEIILDNIQELPTAAERADAAQFVISHARKGSLFAIRGAAQLNKANIEMGKNSGKSEGLSVKPEGSKPDTDNWSSYVQKSNTARSSPELS